MGGDKYDAMVRCAEDGATDMGRVPLLTEEIHIDDKGVTLVFIFPRSEDDGGPVDPERLRKNAREDAEKIFYRPTGWYHSNFSLFETLGDGAVKEGRYQELLRSEFLQLLQKGGLRATSSESIDGDEVFLKVSLGTDNPWLGQLAEHYMYTMPLNEDLYEQKCDDHGVHVPAYTTFAEPMANKLEDFRQVDEIRVVVRWILNRINLEEMKSQGIITTYFPAIQYNEMRQLCEEWALLSKSICLPNPRDAELVREYFGEQIAFFFYWFASYNKYMVILAVVSSLTFFVVRNSVFGSLLSTYAKSWYAVFLVGWIASFNELFKRKANRLKQKWGMKDWDSQQGLSLPSYRPELDGTRLGNFLKSLATSAVVVYVTIFAGIIMAIDAKNNQMRENGDMRLAVWGPYLISLLMKVSSFIWGKIANRLVLLQNHRTESRHNDALAWTVSSVKLFVALFPFLELAFIQRYVNKTCMDTLPEAAAGVYNLGFPPGTPLAGAGANILASNITAADLEFLGAYHHENRYGHQCVSGCYPAKCWTKLDGGYECSTICWEGLKVQLAAFYVLQVVTSVIFLVIPIILTSTAVVWEMCEVMEIRNRCSAVVRSLLGMRLTSNAESDSNGASYSLLQYQAKCSATSPYEYGSYGGSYVEDFLDLAIGYTLQACFNQVLPSMAIIGVFAHMFLYRILAYRMLNVTCRPFPYGSEGIGIWQSILDTIATLAVTCNVAIATFLQSPIKDWRLERQLIFFILAEKGLFMIRGLMASILPDQPDDVTRIEDYNAHVAADLTTRPLPWADKTHDFSKVDIGLFGPGTNSDDGEEGGRSHRSTGVVTAGAAYSQREMAFR